MGVAFRVSLLGMTVLRPLCMYGSRAAEYAAAFLRQQTSSMRPGTAVPGSHSRNNTHGSSVACSLSSVL